MGGDFGPSVTVPASINFLRAHIDAMLLLVGDDELITPHLAEVEDGIRSRMQIVHTPIQIPNESSPAEALRSAKNSSMYIAVNLVKQGRVDACVSGGNTGALLMIGRHLLKTIPGIAKPAIIANIPYPLSGRSGLLLDVGANISCDARNLHEFAIMGAVLRRVVHPDIRPKVALLNIGVEEHKGTEEIRQAARLLGRTGVLDFVGYIEGNELYSGKADVVVCDGFTGNLAIKTSEGVVNVVTSLVNRVLSANLLTRMLGLFFKSIGKSLNTSLDPSKYNGASVLGLQGIIVKSHGNANAAGFQRAIAQARQEIRSNVPSVIQEYMASVDADSLDLVPSS
jgi:glycerol-3-phosphate acyltransferase PlsX